MLTLKHLTDYPKTVKTLNKWIIAREPTIHNITMPNQYFYIGDDADHNRTKLQQLHDAGFEKAETKGLQFINYYTAENLAAISETKWKTAIVIILQIYGQIFCKPYTSPHQAYPIKQNV